MKARIGLGAGHGGTSHGTSSPDGTILEPVMMLELAHRAAALMAWSSIVEPYLIRQGDMRLQHSERNGIALRAGCIAVVELHLNWSDDDPARHGGEIYYRRGDSDGRALGVEIFGVVPKYDWRTWIADDQVKGARDICNAHELPCALLEWGFLSNAGDCLKLKKPDTLDLFAQAIATGSESWARDFYKESKPPCP